MPKYLSVHHHSQLLVMSAYRIRVVFIGSHKKKFVRRIVAELRASLASMVTSSLASTLKNHLSRRLDTLRLSFRSGLAINLTLAGRLSC